MSTTNDEAAKYKALVDPTGKAERAARAALVEAFTRYAEGLSVGQMFRLADQMNNGERELELPEGEQPPPHSYACMTCDRAFSSHIKWSYCPVCGDKF